MPVMEALIGPCPECGEAWTSAGYGDGQAWAICLPCGIHIERMRDADGRPCNKPRKLRQAPK